MVWCNLLSARDKTIALIGAVSLVSLVAFVVIAGVIAGRDVSNVVASLITFITPTLSVLIFATGFKASVNDLHTNQEQIKAVVNATAAQVNGNTTRLMDTNDALTQQIAQSTPPSDTNGKVTP